MKKYLAIILSIAILAVAIPFGVFAGAGTATDTWDGSKTAPSRQDAAGNWIIETAEELAYVALSGDVTSPTSGKSYKIADNSVFNMNGFEGITPNSTPEDIRTATANKFWYDVDVSDYIKVDTNGDGDRDTTLLAFQGSIDGNGAIIYNVNSKGAYSGLFPQVTSTNVSISNITVKASQFNGYHMVGGIVGRAFGNGFDLAINGCAVENCNFKNASNVGNQKSGTIVGNAEHMGININNCYAANNDFDTTNLKYYGGFVGDSSAFGNALSFTNSISIGSSPFPTVKAGFALTADTKLGKDTCVWSNVYSDTATPDSAFNSAKSGISVLTADAMTGANAAANMSLNWNTWFANVQGVPVLRSFHNIDTVDLQNGKHAEYCVDCNGNLTGLEQNHSPVLNDTANALVCDCGYSEDVVGTPIPKTTDTWDGTADTDWAQDGDGNYLITSAEELYGMVKNDGKVGDTAASFKVADGIKAFYLTDIKALVNGGADATTIFNTIKASSNNWNNNISGAYNADDGFVGNFDGNGATIYGMKAVNTFEVGFMPSVKNAGQTTTIQNVAFKYSYVESTNNNPTAAVVVGTLGIDNTENNTTLNFEKVRVENAYFVKNDAMGAVGKRAGLCSNSYKSNININNCFAADFYGPATASGLLSASNDQNKVSHTNSVCVNTTYKNYEWAATYTNSYSTLADENWKYTKLDSADAAKGAAAQSNMLALDWEGTWFVTTGYPELNIFHSMLPVPADSNGHHSACQIYLDGVQCKTCTPVVEHSYNKETADGKCTVCNADCAHPTTDTRQEDVNGPTCGAAGSYTLVTFCTECNKVTDRAENQVGDGATGNHTFDNTVENPTGLCTVCSTPCGHTDTRWVSNNDGTCTTADTGKTVCNICGVATFTGSNPNFSGTAHTFDKNAADGKCTVCSADCAHPTTNTRQEDVNGPTCGAAGSYTLVTFCTECNKVTDRAENQVGESATGNHTYDKTAANGICTVCSTPCTHANGTSTRNEDVQGPTCGNDGTYTLVTFCNECNKVINRAENQPGEAATGNHTYNTESADGVCTVCFKGCTHPTTDTRRDNIQGPTCLDAGSYDLVTFCTVCNATTDIDPGKVGDAATGHTFHDAEAYDASCSYKGNIAYKYCECGNLFAIDEDDKFSTDYLDFENDIATPIEPDKHEWVEVKAVEATTENEGNVAYKYCEYCALLVVGEKEFDLDEEKIYNDDFWTIIDEKLVELEQQGLSEEKIVEIMNEFYASELHKAIVAAAKAENVKLTIDKIVVESPKTEEPKTENKTEDNKTEENKTEVDNNKTSPDTSDNLVAVALMAALIGAAFVIIRKTRKA